MNPIIYSFMSENFRVIITELQPCSKYNLIIPFNDLSVRPEAVVVQVLSPLPVQVDGQQPEEELADPHAGLCAQVVDDEW